MIAKKKNHHVQCDIIYISKILSKPLWSMNVSNYKFINKTVTVVVFKHDYYMLIDIH